MIDGGGIGIAGGACGVETWAFVVWMVLAWHRPRVEKFYFSSI